MSEAESQNAPSPEVIFALLETVAAKLQVLVDREEHRDEAMEKRIRRLELLEQKLGYRMTQMFQARVLLWVAPKPAALLVMGFGAFFGGLVGSWLFWHMTGRVAMAAIQ